MGNVLLQTPRGLGPVQIYGTVGAGGYRERYDAIDASTTSVGTNVGGGVKINLLGPLRVRVDYRVFKLSGDAVHSTPQRLRTSPDAPRRSWLSSVRALFHRRHG